MKNKRQQSTFQSKLDTVVSVVVAVLAAIILRSFTFEPFKIPSGSMLPTLQIGDYILVNKYAYGYSKFSFPLALIPFEGRIFGSQPKRGDIIVFRPPHEEDVNYVKRLVGLPGDTIQYLGGRLYINDKVVDRTFIDREKAGDSSPYYVNKFKETLPNGVEHVIYEVKDDFVFDNTKRFTVPEGYYFMSGDNRDNSDDSRDWGFVPYENLVGRVATVAISFKSNFRFYNPASWFTQIRSERMFKNPNKMLEK